MILAQPMIDLELARMPQAAREARGALEAMTGIVAPGVLEDLRLMVSELVTNGVRHSTDGPIHLRVWVSGGAVRVETADAGRGFDPSMAAPNAGSGWGLMLVGRLASRWGVIAGDAGTTVWFERSLEGRPANEPAR